MIHRYKVIPYIVLSLLFLHPNIALASDGHFDWSNFTYRVVNLLLFIGIIYFFAGKKIRSFFEERKQRIVKEFEDIAHQKEEVQQALKEIQVKIAKIEEERRRILSHAEEEAIAIKNAILEETEHEIAKITSYAQQRMEIEREKVKQNIIAEVTERIYAEVEKELENNLALQTQKEIFHSSIKKVVAFEEEINSKTLC